MITDIQDFFRNLWDEWRYTDGMVKFLLILLVVLLAFLGWYLHWHYFGIQEGTVYNKDFEPAGCAVINTTYTINNVTYIQPTTHCHGDIYRIWFTDGKETNYDEVPQATWQSIQVGDYFDSRTN